MKALVFPSLILVLLLGFATIEGAVSYTINP